MKGDPGKSTQVGPKPVPIAVPDFAINPSAPIVAPDSPQPNPLTP